LRVLEENKFGHYLKNMFLIFEINGEQLMDIKVRRKIVTRSFELNFDKIFFGFESFVF